MSKKKIAVGLSGGVDSAVSAHLLVEQGFDVTGVYLDCFPDFAQQVQGTRSGCTAQEDRQDALQVALSLGIPFRVIDLKAEYQQRVLDYFFTEYKAGRTPNPDVLCNREIKFGLFYDWAMEQGFDAIATGHYAQILETSFENLAKPWLAVPADGHKDQTYFLYQIRGEQLDHVIFPLGNLTKNEVRAEAEKRKIHVATKKDSTGICFVGQVNVHQFLENELGHNPGLIVNQQGEVLGKHQGLWFYTVGQRYGLELDKKKIARVYQQIEKEQIPAFYVIGRNQEKNELIVGLKPEAYREQFEVNDLHWIHQQPETNQVLVRIRNTGQLYPAQLLAKKDGNYQVKLEEKIFGVAQGQFAVFYYPLSPDQTLCLGGGVIA